jgi:protein-disulfide isomerase
MDARGSARHFDVPNRLTVPVTRRDHHNGPIRAAAHLLEYGDFECPACGVAHQVVKAVRETMGRKLCFTFRNFPLANIHPHSESAAEAAEAAAAQSRYWEMHDLLFEHQSALDGAAIAEYAAALGLDRQRLVREVAGHIYEPRVQEDFVSGIRNGVHETPVFFINGRRYDGPLEVEAICKALRGIMKYEL